MTGSAIVVLAALVALLPTIASWQIRTQLEALGARSVSVEDLSVNPATGEITFARFRSTGPDGGRISAGPAHLRMDLGALARRRVTISQLSIANADVKIRHGENGRWSVAGIPMEFGTAKGSPPPPPSDSAPWQLIADDVGVDDSAIALTIGGDTYSGNIDRLRIGGLTTLKPDEPARLELKLRTGGGEISLDGTAKPFLPAPEAAFDISVRNVAVDPFEPVLTTGRMRELDGRVTLDGRFEIAASDNGVARATYDGKLNLAGGRAESGLFRAKAETLAWKGRMHFGFGDKAAADGQLPSVRVQGEASAKGFSFLNKASKDLLQSRTATFDMAEAGVRFEPGIDAKGSSRISGKLVARLEAADFAQPESGLRVAAGHIAATGEASFLLPPGTNDFSGKLGGTLNAETLSGAMKTAGIETLEAKSLRLAYRDLALSLTGAGAIDVKTTADLTTEGFSMSVPASGVRARGAKISGDKAKLAFHRSPDGVLELRVEGPLEASQLHAEASDGAWTTEQGSFSWMGRLSIGGNASGKSEWSVDGSLESRDVAVSVSAPALEARLASSSWTGTAGAASGAGSLKLDGDAKMSRLKINLKGSSPMAATVGALQASRIDIAGTSAQVARLSMTGFDAHPAAKGSHLPRAALRSLVLQKIASKDGERIEIGGLRGTGGKLRLTRGSDGKLALPIANGAKQSGDPRSQRAGSGAGTLSVRADNVVVADTTLAYVDRTLDPPFEIETSRFQLSVKDLDTAKPDSNAQLKLLVGLGKYGRVDVSGSASPDTRAPSADLNVAFDDLELFKFNPYIEPVIERAVRQGRADGNMDLKLKKGVLNAQTRLRISKLELQPQKDAGTDASPPSDRTVLDPKGTGAGSAPPIETAIALLENDDGVIELSIPISGSLEDPQFDLSDAIGQAVGNALKDTVMTAFKIAFPLGAVFAAVDATGNSQIEIAPLRFGAGQASLTPDLTARVDEVGRFLNKKKDASPSLCGYATPADVEALKKTGKTDAAADAAAVGLAQRRMDAVRERLVKKDGIAPKRLFLCAPEIDRADGAAPRVEVSL